MAQRPPFNYQPEELSRELKPFYIGATESEVDSMLKTLGYQSLEEIFSHLDPSVLMQPEQINLPPRLSYEQLAEELFRLSKKNNILTSFAGDGLAQMQTTDIVDEVCAVRGLTTAYTPYQPERSQGTLRSLWIYQSALSAITGFEAVNASLYERSTCLYEAIQTGIRLHKKSQIALVSDSLYPGDKEVLNTLADHTKCQIIYYPHRTDTSCVDLEQLEKLLQEHSSAVLVYPQVNSFGHLEPVDKLQDLATQYAVKSVAVIDPLLLANGALKAPVHYGSQEQGADMIVGEGQHLAIGANFGGPGLGIFGIRFHKNDKHSIRATAGRYVGKSKDVKGRECLAMVLSTREQHIRREKATSNICSNQSFIATLAGAALLRRGCLGLAQSALVARENAYKVARALSLKQGIKLLFDSTPFFNEFTLRIENKDLGQLEDLAIEQSLEIGINISARLDIPGQLLKMSFSDLHSDDDIQKLIAFFDQHFPNEEKTAFSEQIPSSLLRQKVFYIPQMSKQDVIAYYQQLGRQNISPDDGIYPLGSCTMKYNPYINDWAASLKGFTNIHPQSNVKNTQGCLEILYQIQEQFKAITGLDAVTTQPVAGAQGELVGLKMFQAYHRDRGEEQQRRVILIPKSAHGTNPATATVAGFETFSDKGLAYGIISLQADSNGMIDMQQLEQIILEHGPRIAGVMVTNPNTAGIFEASFKEMANKIHQIGGLVYMDGANMNAIAGIVNLKKLGVDAVHNNLHKTWTIPHGGGGPGDAIVAVSERLQDYLPGGQVIYTNETYQWSKASKSIGSFHRHHGNFAHKVRTYTYLRALGQEGVRRMSAISVLSAQYLFKKLSSRFPTLPQSTENVPRMHEFIITLEEQTFKKIEQAGIAKAKIIARVGKMFLDFGFHAPTVAFPEQYGLMIEPTESFSKAELDQFAEVVLMIERLINEKPQLLHSVPHFTPIDMVDEVAANKNLILAEALENSVCQLQEDRFDQAQLRKIGAQQVYQKLLNRQEQASP